MKQVAIIIGILLLIIIVIAAPRSFESSNFTVKTAVDGNALILDNGYRIVLLGVNGSDESQEFLNQIQGKNIRVVMDSSSPRLVSMNKEQKTIYAYVKNDRKCLNSMILSSQKSDICIMPNLTDSLEAYLSYVGREGDYYIPEPMPEKDNQIVRPDDENDRKNERTPIAPHKGSETTGWSSNCSDNCNMLKVVVDFKNPTTRNFAINLASKSPGEYNFGQICAIFDHLYNNWKYVNDPSGAEYVAKASESISVANLSGDCDDFAVTMCACIIAIGGNARINTSWGRRGGHAFTEVDVTGLSETEMRKSISKLFSHYSIKNLCSRQSNGRVWLNLDWQAAYPGGKYFQFEECTIYEKDANESWKCK